ncbi:hypothetical protein FE257_005503 [Aspergillus nanangensis]|uniref:3'-5' exonuclease domain-containing protein n=1 Tax=Aspergillus nanangensis TaxID=2582783 RepID=A0AAD4CB99_ASPNN|nr:hypothetical protein FE257_005503 [Aspergillus nanangensis]
MSIKRILESPTTLKVLFDARRDSDALFSLYGISLDGIRDVQLMELGTRRGSKCFLSSLEECIKNDSTISVAEKKVWKKIKNDGRELLGYVLNERPVRPEVQRYCAGDVIFLPELFNKHKVTLSQPGKKFWELHVLEATKERIRLSQSQMFNPVETGARSPWDDYSLEEEVNQWNDDILDEAIISQNDGLNDIYDLMNIMDEEDYGLANDHSWVDDGPTSCRDIINDCDYDYYYSDYCYKL